MTRVLREEENCVFSCDDSITSSHAHFFELKRGVSAVCVFVCVHCWWIKTTVADGVSEWEAGKEKNWVIALVCAFLSSFLPKNASVTLLLSHTQVITAAIVYQWG